MTGTTHNSYTTPHLLPVRGLNEIFIGESLSSRYLFASYAVLNHFDLPAISLSMKHTVSSTPLLLTPCIPSISPYLWISICHRVKYKSFKPHLTLSLHRASYYEISIDDGPWEKQKSSGLSICTGTGSKAW